MSKKNKCKNKSRQQRQRAKQPVAEQKDLVLYESEQQPVVESFYNQDIYDKRQAVVNAYSMDGIDYNSAGWYNDDNQFGFQTDPNFSTKFGGRSWIPTVTLLSMYESDPLTGAFVNLWMSDSTRKGYQLIDKEDAGKANELHKDIEKYFKLCGVMSKGVGVDKLLGGGVLYLDIDDGREPDEPLNENNIRKIWSIRSIDRDYCKPWIDDDLTKTESPSEPLIYQIQLMSRTKSETINVHASRLIRLPDFQTDNNLSQISRQQRQGWPVSDVQRAYDTIKKHGVGFQSITQHLQNMVVDIFKVEDLDKLSNTENFFEYIRRQWKAKNSLRANVMGVKESLERVGTPLTGVDSILDYCNQFACMTFGVGLSILFSNESGGLGGNTISGDRLIWFDKVKSYQNKNLVPVVERVVYLRGLEKGIDTSNITVKFNDLHELSEKEKLENRKTAFEADALFISNTGYPGTELMKSRISGDELDLHTYQYDEEIIDDYLEDLQNEEINGTGEGDQRDIEQSDETDNQEDDNES